MSYTFHQGTSQSRLLKRAGVRECFNRDGTPKKRYDRYDQAKGAANRASTIHAGYDAYECHCGYFHIGHRQRR